MAETKRQKLNRRLRELVTLRSTHEVQWRDQSDQILPYRARWADSDHNRGEALESTITNSTPAESLRTLAAGLMAGITSPSRPWFTLATRDKQLNKVHRVKVWLDESADILREVLLRSRWYQTLASGIYRDLPMVSNSAMWMLEDPALYVRCESLPIGEGYLDVGADGMVDTCFRKIPMTVRQIVQDFGLENCSDVVQKTHQQGQLGTKYTVVNAIFPNEDWRGSGWAGRFGKRWASYWWEEAAPEKPEKWLREGGYDEFPILAPRWSTRGREVYGIGSPGWQCVGDCKGLQELEKTKLQLVDKLSRPPMRGPAGLGATHGRMSLLPGRFTAVPDNTTAKYEPAIVIDPRGIMETRESIREHEGRIQRAFFVDLWRALLDDPRKQRPTATEVERTREEVMLQLGPLLESLNTELLDPGIDRAWAILHRAGVFGDPPPELDGAEVRVHYVSILHQAQRLTALSGLREMVVMASSLAQLGMQAAIDKIDADAVMDELAEILDVKPELILSEDEVLQVRRAKAEMEQAQQQGQAMLAATEGARNLSGVEPQKLGDIAAMMSPAAAAQGGAL